MEGLTTREATWLERFERRKWQWQSGQGAFPLGPTFRRYEVPKASWTGGQVIFELMDHLDRIDPALEILFDKFTVRGGPNSLGPGHHLVTRLEGSGECSADLLRMELTLQWDIDEDGYTWAWPDYRLRAPGMWLIASLRKHYIGKAPGGELNPVRRHSIKRSQDRVKEKRAEAVKACIDIEMDITKEILPYFHSEDGGVGRTIHRTGKQMLPGKRNPNRVVVDVGAAK